MAKPMCRVCLVEKKAINNDFNHEDKLDHYIAMLQETFVIQKLKSKENLICDDCVEQLEDANKLKQLITRSDDYLASLKPSAESSVSSSGTSNIKTKPGETSDNGGSSKMNGKDVPSSSGNVNAKIPYLSYPDCKIEVAVQTEKKDSPGKIYMDRTVADVKCINLMESLVAEDEEEHARAAAFYSQNMLRSAESSTTQSGNTSRVSPVPFDNQKAWEEFIRNDTIMNKTRFTGVKPTFIFEDEDSSNEEIDSAEKTEPAAKEDLSSKEEISDYRAHLRPKVRQETKEFRTKSSRYCSTRQGSKQASSKQETSKQAKMVGKEKAKTNKRKVNTGDKEKRSSKASKNAKKTAKKPGPAKKKTQRKTKLQQKKMLEKKIQQQINKTSK